MIVEWDEEKNKINTIKHGISFQTARLVFADENLVVMPDIDHSVYEERYKVIGKVGRRKIILVVCTDRNSAIRIISARQANAYERGIYLDKLNDGI
ncbi:MAG: BrnT family toxin [Selenomonadaceae bacterium]|nr:BrnT family toxin [Selenomonadaceae bacterium]MBR3722991.1 BrnT family toxin [Selenomonadaceae bacterium]